MILVTCRTEWKIPFDFVEHVGGDYEMGGNPQIKGVSDMLQTFVWLRYKLLSTALTFPPKRGQPDPRFSSITFVRQNLKNEILADKTLINEKSAQK